MKPVFQDQFGKEGNCMAACAASILELPLRDVPNFVYGDKGDGQYFARFYQFMYSHGWEVIPYHLVGFNYETKQEFDRSIDFDNLPEHLKDVYCYHFACGPAARGFEHATVGWRDQIVHDPHPSKAGLIKVTEYYFLKRITK